MGRVLAQPPDRSVTGRSGDQVFESPSSPSGTTGSRFPHVSLVNGSQHLSTPGSIKRNLVLVATEPHSTWAGASQAVTTLKIEVYELHASSNPLQDAQANVKAKMKLAEGEACCSG